jgi:hypothetical protein
MPTGIILAGILLFVDLKDYKHLSARQMASMMMVMMSFKYHDLFISATNLIRFTDILYAFYKILFV